MDTQNQINPSGRDPHLWEMAKRRASFRYHLIIYVVVNVFLWSLWLISSNTGDKDPYPWPIWSTMGWGIGLCFHFLGAFVFPKENIVEKEYQRLLNQKKN